MAQVKGFCLGTVFLLITVLSYTISAARHNLTLHQKLRDDADLSEFYSLLDRNEIANATLSFRSCTVFAPLNSAFQKFSGPTDNNLVLYHMTNSAQTLTQIGGSVSSELEGNPPLWVTKTESGDVFINNAKVVQQRSNFVHTSEKKKQVLHILEGVLEPVRATSGSDGLVYNPNAYQFLNNSENFDLENHRVRSFRQRVNTNNKQDVFGVEGKYTFFIPVDEGFQPPPRPDKIDHKVIDGHIIPNKVLFTSATNDGQEFETLAFTDMLKVTVSFSTETDGKEVKKYVKSHTIVGDSNHPGGVVLAEIVKANIPVRNGVVHLIHRPLMVVDTTITEFLESFKGIDREDGPLYKFYEVIRDVEGDFMDRLTKMKELTLFAPSNAAWKDTNLNNFIRDRKRMSELLNMHLVAEKLTLEKIVYNNQNQVATMAPRRNLYFNVILNGGNKTLTVEGGGVNATVIQPDIAATNGIVHIIDRVLGVPFTTVGRKLATDPMLNKTYIMGRSEGFNDQLDEVKKKFTYFVPRDYAWNRMETKYPSAHKKLFMHDFAYHARQILERHLVVADQPYKMAELKNMTLYEAKELPTVRDVVKIKVKESEKSYYVEWNNEWVHVFRPDVECTNGVIHVIDAVFLRESDIHVTGSGEIVQPLRVTLGFIICLIISQYL